MYYAAGSGAQVADYKFKNEYDFVKFGINYYFK
jgi:hypothetical protein